MILRHAKNAKDDIIITNEIPDSKFLKPFKWGTVSPLYFTNTYSDITLCQATYAFQILTALILRIPLSGR